MVLDADLRSRDRLDSALSAASYRVVSTADPDLALQTIRDDSPEFVLVDLAMGAMEPVPRWHRRRGDPEPTSPFSVSDGYAILQALGAGPTPSPQMVVLLRARQSPEARAQRFCVVDHLAKPFDPEQLRQRIESLRERIESRSDETARPGTVSAAPTAQPSSTPPLPTRAANPKGSVAWGEADRRAAASQAMPGLAALPQALRDVLVADGDAAARRALAEVLTPHGFAIHEAADGEQALRIALARRPWMIVTEVNLPGIDGFEFCRRVRSHALLRYTPLVFFAAWDDYAERELALRLGADEYFSKQTPARELLIRLQLIFARYLGLTTSTHQGSGMAGTIELIGAIGLLQICHLGRLTGVCTVHSASDTAQVRFREGEIVAARCGRRENADAIYELVAWGHGHFEFVPGSAGSEPTLEESLESLLLEGCRRLDDSHREGGAQEIS